MIHFLKKISYLASTLAWKLCKKLYNLMLIKFKSNWIESKIWKKIGRNEFRSDLMVYSGRSLFNSVMKNFKKWQKSWKIRFRFRTFWIELNSKFALNSKVSLYWIANFMVHAKKLAKNLSSTSENIYFSFNWEFGNQQG